MEGPTRPLQQGESSRREVEVDYIQRIMSPLTDSQAVPSQLPSQVESGIHSRSYAAFHDSYARIPDINPGLNPWSFFPPPPELRGLVADSSKPCSWQTDSPQHVSPIQREILAEFPWLHEELNNRRLITTGAASSSEVTFPRLASKSEYSQEVGFTTSKEESDACTSAGPFDTPTPPTPTTNQVAWAQSMLEFQAFENEPEVFPLLKAQRQTSTSLVNLPDQSTSVTPANSETPFLSESLSSSLSDGKEEEPPKKGTRNVDSSSDAAGTSAQSGKRKRPDQEEGEDAPSDDQETKKPSNRPRKKGGVKRVREPRYAIKTRTDTEVMDDGYKWRKYGQKAVKNSPHPRNYYRCTTLNCPVRKRVERCFEDPGLVVTTYEGTHTHQSPSFLRGPPGYPGGLQGLLHTLSHHYSLAGNPALPPFSNPVNNPFNLSSSDLYRSSPLRLSQQESIQENLNILRARERLRLQQKEAAAAAAWASSIKSEPFQFNAQEFMNRPQETAPQTNFPGPSFSNVSSLTDLSYETRMNHYNPVSELEQLGTTQHQLPGSESDSLIPNTGFSVQNPGFPRMPEFAEAGASCSQDSTGASSDGGLLEDMLKTANPIISRARTD